MTNGEGGGGNNTSGDSTGALNNRSEAQQSVTQAAERELALTNQIVQATITTTEQLKAQQKIMEDISTKLGESFQAQQKFLDRQQINISNFSKTFQELSKNAEKATDMSEALAKEFGELKKENASLYEELMKISEMPLEEAVSAFEVLKGELQLAGAAGKDADKSIKSFAGSLGFAGKISDTFSGKIAQNILKLSSLSTKAAKKELLNSFTNSIRETFSPLNIFSSLLDNLIKSALEFDKAAKSLSSSFGEMGAFQRDLTANAGSIARMGLTATQQAELVTELVTGFSSFSAEVEKNREILKTNNAALKALGVQTSNANEIIEIMSTGMGKTSVEASNLTMKLAAAGAAFGKTSQQMVSDFASLAKSIVAYGDRMEKVFFGLQEQAKRTGISVTNLNSLAEGFDTFSDAASKAGQINALFGTSLSAMGLNSMDADERLAELKQQFSFLDPNNMSRYEKMALKQAAGFSTIAEAVQFLGGELTDAEKDQMEMAKAQQEMADTMQSLAKATLPLAKQLELMFSEITSNAGNVDAIISGLKTLSKLFIYASQNIEMTIFTLIAFKTIGLVLPVILNSLATSINFVGIASKFATTGGLLGLVSILVTIFALLHLKRSPEFYLLFGVVALGILAMGMAAQTTQAGLYAIAAAALAVGIAVSAIFYTLSMAVDSFTALFTTLSEGSEKFPLAAAGLYMMAGGMTALGSAALLASTGLIAAMSTLGIMNTIFNLGGGGFSEMIKAGESVTKMGNSIDKFGSGLEKIKSVATQLKNSIGDSMIAATMEGEKLSLVVGKEAGVATLFKNDTLNIKVDMPTINIPTPKFDVYLDGKIIDARIEKRYNK